MVECFDPEKDNAFDLNMRELEEEDEDQSFDFEPNIVRRLNPEPP